MCVRSWYVALSAWGCPWPEKGCQAMPVIAAPESLSAAAPCRPAEPRDSTKYLVMVDAGVGRCLGAGAMQNMQEGG